MSLEAQIETLNNNLAKLATILEAALKGGAGITTSTSQGQPAPVVTTVDASQSVEAPKKAKPSKKAEAPTPSEPEPETPEPKTTEAAPAADRKAVTEAAKALLGEGKRDVVLKALQAVGAKTLKDCPDADLGKLLKALNSNA